MQEAPPGSGVSNTIIMHRGFSNNDVYLAEDTVTVTDLDRDRDVKTGQRSPRFS